MVVVGGGGTRYDCLGGLEESERSTLMYASYASPSEFSGTQVSRREDDGTVSVGREEDDAGLCAAAGLFCCTSATKPGMLSLAEGEGCTYTCFSSVLGMLPPGCWSKGNVCELCFSSRAV